jgi:hypothetical protein
MEKVQKPVTLGTCFLDISVFAANLRTSPLRLNHICYYVAYINRHMHIHAFQHSSNLYSKRKYVCFYLPLCPVLQRTIKRDS